MLFLIFDTEEEKDKFTMLYETLAAQNIHMLIIVTVIVFLILEICVYLLYPVANTNRIIGSVENKYYKRMLKRVLKTHIAIVAVCAVLKYSRCLIVYCRQCLSLRSHCHQFCTGRRIHNQQKTSLFRADAEYTRSLKSICSKPKWISFNASL